MFKETEGETLKKRRKEDSFKEFCHKEDRNEAVAKGKMLSVYERNGSMSINEQPR